MECLGLETCVRQAFFSAQWPIRSMVWSQVAETEVLRVWSELSQFPSSVCSSPSSTGTLAPEESSVGARGVGMDI